MRLADGLPFNSRIDIEMAVFLAQIGRSEHIFGRGLEEMPDALTSHIIYAYMK
jgi:hypothetical protein